MTSLIRFLAALDTEVTSWGGVIVTPGPKAFERQDEKVDEGEEEENEGGEAAQEEAAEAGTTEEKEEKMDTTNQDA